MKRLILDMSSVIWTSLMAGKDIENGKKVTFVDKEVHINSADWGFQNAINHILKACELTGCTPKDFIMVFEGKESKYERQQMFAEYKAGRERAPEYYDEFNICKDTLRETFLNLGATACSQDFLEADDVIGYLCRSLEGEKIILTNDGDLAVLVDETTHILKNGEIDRNPFGDYFPHRFITVYKALVGDTSDNYKGAKGFGEKAFRDLYIAFGDDGLELMEELIVKNQLHRLAEDVGTLKALQKIIDAAADVRLSYKLAVIYSDKVNTMRRPLHWQAGMVKADCPESLLRKWAQKTELVHAGNYDKLFAWATSRIKTSPAVALDIETATPDASDEWLERLGKAAAEDDEKSAKVLVDVFGSELTGLSLTFGANNQFTLYLTHDHRETDDTRNLTLAQVRDFVALVPKTTRIYVHNAAFELPVLYNEWGQDWQDDPEWHGFLPNVRDTRIMCSYADENMRSGLKERSAAVLGYQQTTYAEVTTKTDLLADLPAGGKLIKAVELAEGLVHHTKQYKMNERPAREVTAYGCDDTICTLALANFYRIKLELEKSWHVYEEVETLPAYVTALAFVQGIPFSQATMEQQITEDDATYDAAWATMRTFLLDKGWDGTVCPAFTEWTPANIKEGYEIITGEKLDCKMRIIDKIGKHIGSLEDVPRADLISRLILDNDLAGFNAEVAHYFDGEPVLDTGSPKQMRKFLYQTIGTRIQLVNDCTAKEKQDKPDLARAVMKFNMARRGKEIEEITPEEQALLLTKAKTDDSAVDFALAFDKENCPPGILEAFQAMKKVATRRSLYYKKYPAFPHWKDGLIHANINQCATVTRRYSSSAPNVQQWPKKGEGVKFRKNIRPHKAGAVVGSIDFSGQELRLAADRSQDRNMLACYIGTKLKDIHSITAAGAMELKWGADFVESLFNEFHLDRADEDGLYDLFVAARKSEKYHKKADDHRKNAKNVNFAAQNGARAAKISETETMPLQDAQLFLDAREVMFPDVGVAAKRAEGIARDFGYAATLMGARRHLAHAILSDDRQESARAARQAWNFEIQGSAAEMTKLAMARLWQSGVMFRYDMQFFAPVHDELVFSVVYEDTLAVVREVHDCMTAKYATMAVPILGSISIGPNFGDQRECGDWFIPENVQRELDTITKERITAKVASKEPCELV